MRNTLLASGLLIWLMTSMAFTVNAQRKASEVSLLAYKRSSMPGTFPKGEGSEKTGLPSGAAKPIVQYFIYLQNAPVTVHIERLVLEGISYSATLQQVTRLPVVMESGMPGRFASVDTLVAGSNLNVLRVIPLEPDNRALKGRVRRLSRKSAAVVVYKDDRTTYYCIAGQFKILKPIVLQ